MILKEIAFDFDFNLNDINLQTICINDTAIVSSNDIVRYNWKAIRRVFELKTCCMTSMVSRIMKSVDYGNIKKIVVNCMANNNFYISNVGGFINIGVSFDYNLFMSLSDYEKKKYTIDVLSKAIEQIEAKLNFDMYSVKYAIAEVKRQNYNNEWVWKKVRKKKEEISIIVHHDTGSAKIYIQHTNGSEIISKSLLVETEPSEWAYAGYLGKLSKENSDAFLVDRLGKIIATESFCE